MKQLGYCTALVLLVLTIVACGKKEEQSEVVPPGFCKTDAECQPGADRQNADQADLRRKLSAQGVHDQYLPCGPYKSTKAPNGFWEVTHDTTGCPPTAGQQDLYPDVRKLSKPQR
jgi:hypothetical protein